MPTLIGPESTKVSFLLLSFMVSIIGINKADDNTCKQGHFPLFSQAAELKNHK